MADSRGVQQAAGGLSNQSVSAAREPLLTFSSGGWILWVAGALCLAVIAWRGSVIASQWNHRAKGDGRNVETYGFDLSNLAVDRALLLATDLPRNGMPALDHVKRLTLSEADDLDQELRKNHRHKFVVDSDLVVGVVRNDEAAAYPLRLLAWHQVVNDTVGGEPVLITYDPLCDSAVAFDPRLSGGGAAKFGFSGLVWNGNLLVYDRVSEGAKESLWSQLQFRCIAGPRVGEELAIAPFEVMTWGDWKRLHPQTTVMPLDKNRIRVYRQTLHHYYGTDQLQFPVDPLPPASDHQRLKTPMLAWRGEDGGWRHQPAGASAEGSAAAGGSEKSAVLRVFWFAWHAHHPESRTATR